MLRTEGRWVGPVIDASRMRGSFLSEDVRIPASLFGAAKEIDAGDAEREL